MKNITNYLALGAVALGLTGAAQAVPTLRISDGINPAITVADGSGSDSNGAAGVVTWIGATGVWTVNVDTGITKPQVGSNQAPYMDLAFVDVSSAAGTLTLMFSETGFTQLGSALAKIGGTTAGTVTYATYWSASNNLFALDNLLSNQGPFGPGAFAGTSALGLVAAQPYSLTQVITITHSGAGTSSGDAELTVPDSGSTIALLGAALATLGLISRRRKVA